MDGTKFVCYFNLVEEFYASTNAERISEIDQILRATRKQLNTAELITLSFELFARERSSTLQLHGAMSLYEAILRRQNSIVTDIELCGFTKSSLVRILLERFSTQLRSISDKQISCLALLALQTMPDIWEDPILDLSREFAAVPGLLLKILSEIAYQYRNFNAPVDQRMKVKEILVRRTKDVTNYIMEMLRGVSSTSNFAFENIAECLTNWMNLPGMDFGEWGDLIIEYLLQVQTDSAALSSLFQSLSKNEQFPRLENLVMQVSHHLATTVRQKVVNDIMQGDTSSDDLMELVDSITRLSEELSSSLIRMARNDETKHILHNLCELLSDISSYSGVYAVDETLSDIPTSFFTMLREDLSNCDSESVKALVQASYIKILKSGIEKVAWPTHEVYRTMDHLQIEAFTKYREAKCEIALNCFIVVGPETFSFMNQMIEEAITNNEWERIEVILYLLYSSSNTLSEKYFAQLYSLFGLLKKIADVPNDDRGERLGTTMMKFFYELGHLIREHDQNLHLEIVVYEFCASFLHCNRAIDSALRTLVEYASKRGESLQMCGDVLLKYCYDSFGNPALIDSLKLEALKVIGYILSIRPSDDIIENVVNILSPIFVTLQDKTTDDDTRIAKIKMFSAIFSSIQQKDENSVSKESPLSILLERFAPFFVSLILDQGPGLVTDEVLTTLRVALLYLRDSQVPDFLDFYYRLLDITLGYNSKVALELAGTLVLALHTNRESLAQYIKQLAHWTKVLESKVEQMDDANLDIDDWLSLFYKILRKEWITLRSPLAIDEGSCFIDSCIQIGSRVLQSTLNIYAVRTCAQVFAVITSKCDSTNDFVIKQLIIEKGIKMLEIISQRLSTETTKHNIDLFAETLLYFAKHHPSEIRRCLEHYDAPLVNSLLQYIGRPSTFKTTVNKLNQVVRKRQLIEE